MNGFTERYGFWQKIPKGLILLFSQSPGPVRCRRVENANMFSPGNDVNRFTKMIKVLRAPSAAGRVGKVESNGITDQVERPCPRGIVRGSLGHCDDGMRVVALTIPAQHGLLVTSISESEQHPTNPRRFAPYP